MPAFLCADFLENLLIFGGCAEVVRTRFFDLLPRPRAGGLLAQFLDIRFSFEDGQPFVRDGIIAVKCPCKTARDGGDGVGILPKIGRFQDAFPISNSVPVGV